MRAERKAQLDARPFGALRGRLGWPLAIVGGLVFVASYVGAGAGFSVLPFDSHHIVGQLGGGAVGLFGLLWATTGSDPRRDERRKPNHQGRTTRQS